jgi:hypothetical protein
MKNPTGTGRVASATLSPQAPSQDRVAEATPPVGANLHRNNAAEWLMVIVLTPISWITLGWQKIFKLRASTEPSGSAAGVANPPRKPVMIEGLPPRTMN